MKIPKVISPSLTLTLPFCQIACYVESHYLVRITFCDKPLKNIPPSCHLTEEIVRQFDAYVQSPAHEFQLPVLHKGTPFQEKVWAFLQKIPAGETLSYMDVAQQLKTGPRAVGSACRYNPLPFIIPCHRIIAKTSQGGFNGQRQGVFFDIKEKLLTHEAQINSKNDKK